MTIGPPSAKTRAVGCITVREPEVKGNISDDPVAKPTSKYHTYGYVSNKLSFRTHDSIFRNFYVSIGSHVVWQQRNMVGVYAYPELFG